ncbi:MAG: hypothetical protein IKL22_05100 [Lachnospiraceae bacterium]|nr:hypothetical protein [Lachnospiraceae bacterium]
MNCWIILLLLCCCGKNNSVAQTDLGCDCHEHHNHCHSSCIQPRMQERDVCNIRREKEEDCEHEENSRSRNDGCSCAAEERVRERWMPYNDYNDNDRRECGCK